MVVGTRLRVRAGRGLQTLLVLLPVAVWAQSVSDETLHSLLHSAAATPPIDAPRTAPPSDNASSLAAPADLGWLARRPRLELRVEEIAGPSLPGMVPSRKHHALSWRNDGLSRALDQAGWRLAECRNRVRMPSRLKQSPGAATSIEVQLQIAVGCSF